MPTNELTPEEIKEFEKISSTLLKDLKSDAPIAKAYLASLRRNKVFDEEAQEQALALRKDVAHAVPEQNSLMTWCGYPTDLTRCSPFFPMGVKEIAHRPYLENFVITSANWGEITYTGPKLSTYEEDILLALLAILNNVSQYRKTTQINGEKTYTYQGPILPLLKLMGNKSPGKSHYQRLLSGLDNLNRAQVKLFISSGKTKTGKKRNPKKIHMVNMLSSVVWDDEKKELSVTVNPFFYEAYFAGTITLLDVQIRAETKSPITKALYRFIQSHRKNPIFTGHFLTLADALNMERSHPAIEIRRLLKKAINELVNKKILTNKSKFVDQDIVTLERNTRIVSKNDKPLH